jgi:membrane glycosyltransferase
MITLFIFAMGTLLVPKILGLLRALINGELLRTVGVVRLILGVPVETALSALYAPIAMMIQTKQIWEIMRGRDSGWAVQARKRTTLPWSTLWRRHWLHMLVGLAVSAGLAIVSPGLLAWMAPSLIGLSLALPLSAASASVMLAKLTGVLGFLTIPEEVVTPRVLHLRDECEKELSAKVGLATVDRLLVDERLRHRHFSSVLPRPQAPRGKPDMALLSARAKLADARTLEEAMQWLSPPERLAVLDDAELFHELVKLHGTTERQASAPVLRSA